MIDEKKLDSWITQHTTSTEPMNVMISNYDDVGELLRLARLGLWAKEHGIPTLESVDGYFHKNWALDSSDVTNAFAALPKEPQ